MRNDLFDLYLPILSVWCAVIHVSQSSVCACLGSGYHIRFFFCFVFSSEMFSCFFYTDNFPNYKCIWYMFCSLLEAVCWSWYGYIYFIWCLVDIFQVRNPSKSYFSYTMFCIKFGSKLDWGFYLSTVI